MTEESSVEGIGGWVWGCAYVHMKVRAAVKLSRNDALHAVKDLTLPFPYCSHEDEQTQH